jgi:RNA polymerase sigma-70 factor (ECF subfamily)
MRTCLPGGEPAGDPGASLHASEISQCRRSPTGFQQEKEGCSGFQRPEKPESAWCGIPEFSSDGARVRSHTPFVILCGVVDELALLAQLRQGDSGALAEVSQRYRARLVAAARAILRDSGEAEDVAQEVLFRAPTMSEIKDVSSLRSYLESAARRLAIDRLRRRQTGDRVLERASQPRQVAGPLEQAEQADERRRLLQALAGLKQPYRKALELRYLEGQEFRDVATRLGTNERTARTWVGRGLTLLRRKTEGWR